MTTVIIILFFVSISILLVSGKLLFNTRKNIQNSKNMLESSQFSLMSSIEKYKKAESLFEEAKKINSDSKNNIQNESKTEMIKFYSEYSNNLEDEIMRQIDKKSDHISSVINMFKEKDDSEISKENVNMIIDLIADFLESHLNFDNLKISLITNQMNFVKSRMEDKKSKNLDISEELKYYDMSKELIDSMKNTTNALKSKIDKIKNYCREESDLDLLTNLLLDIIDLRKDGILNSNKSEDNSYSIKNMDKTLRFKTQEEFKKTLDKSKSFDINNSERANLQIFLTTINSLIESKCEENEKWVEALNMIPDVMNEEDLKIWSIYYDSVLSSEKYKKFTSENYPNLTNTEKWVFNSIMKIENSIKSKNNG